MKRLFSLLVVFSLLTSPLALGWESFVHAKGVQDICKALGFSEEQAIRVGDGAWFDGSDIRIERKEGQKDLKLYSNQDRVFNTGVWGEGTPVKTYSKFTVSPNDTRYLNSKKYLNKAIRLAKEGNKDEAFYALGVGVRALQNIFANRETVHDAAWTAQAKMDNGASKWVPGETFVAVWHNVTPDDDVFSNAHSDALKAALQATADYVGEFLTACPQAIENVKRLRSTAIDGIVDETVSLLPAKAELVQKVQKSGREIMGQIDKALVTFPMPKTAADLEKLPPRALMIGPANQLATLAKLAFKEQLKLVKSDVDDFSGSADDEWKKLAKTTEDSLVELQKSVDDVAKTLTAASAALKNASSEDGYAVVRKQLAKLSKAVFTLIKPYLKDEQFFDEQVVYWIDVLQEQMREYTLHHAIELASIYDTLKTQLPKTETAFADFITASNEAVKEYTGRCENALADFNEAMAAIAAMYGKDADGLKQSAAERVSVVSTVFHEKAKQAAESLKAIAPLKQGDEIPKAVEDVIRNLIKDASELRKNAFMNIAPKLSYNRYEEDIDPQKIRGLLAAHAFRQDFLQPIEIGSILPDSWMPAVWKSDDELEITLVWRPRIPTEAELERAKIYYEKGAAIFNIAQDIATSVDYYERVSGEGVTNDVAKDLMGDLVGTKLVGFVLSKGLGLVGKAIGTATPLPGGGVAGEILGNAAGEVVTYIFGDAIAKYFPKAVDYVFGEGTSDTLAKNFVDNLMTGYKMAADAKDYVNDKLNDAWNFTKDGWNDLTDTLTRFFGSDTEEDLNDRVDTFTDDVNLIMDTFDFNNKYEREIGMPLLNGLVDSFMAPFKDLMDVMSSMGLQIRGLMLNLINLAVDIEHVDISSEMDKSLKVLTNDLNTMMGKDNEQDKNTKRKATIENKGRDLKRTSTKGNDLKGAPGVKQIEMKNN